MDVQTHTDAYHGAVVHSCFHLIELVVCLKTLRHVFRVLASITQNELQSAATYVIDY